MRFAIYCRKSTEDEGESTDSQTKACRELANKHTFTILNDWVVEEQDVSGRVSREKLDRIIKASYRRPLPFDGLLIWTISRQARDMSLTMELFDAMRANRVQVWRADQGREVPNKTPQDIMMLMVEAYGAADQPFQTGRAVHRAHRQKAKQGWQVAGREFGYDLFRVCKCGVRDCVQRGEDHKGHTERVVNKEQAAIIKKIFELSADGLGDGKIVKKVKHLPAPGAKGWSKEAVKRILRRDIYRGWVVWGRSSRNVIRNEAGRKVYSRSAMPESEWVREYIPGLRIVSDELWEKVRRRKAKTLLHYGNQATLDALGDGKGRTGESGVNVSASLLGSIAKCWVCKGSLVQYHDRGRPHYRCRTRYAKDACTNSRGVPAKVLEQAVRSAITEALEDPANVDALVQTLKQQGERWKRDREDRDQPKGEPGFTFGQVKKLRLAVERLEDAIEKGQPVGDRLKQRRSELDALEAKLAEPAPPVLTRAELIKRIDAALSPLERMKRDYKEAKQEMALEIRGALRALGIERIIVTPLAKGWRVEGMANLDRIIAGGSDAPVNLGSAGGSAATMPARYTVSPWTTACESRGPTP